MSNEEFERKMEFIVEQQAQFASDIQQLRASQAQTEQVIAQTGEIVGQTGEIVARLANVTFEGFKDVNAKIAALVDSHIRLSEAQSRTNENLSLTNAKFDALVDSHIRLSESQSRTDEALRNLIAAVDRYFSEGRNGH
jgi:cysteine sulfinate desulfinase/cysteine desulfurase-like protein